MAYGFFRDRKESYLSNVGTVGAGRRFLNWFYHGIFDIFGSPSRIFWRDWGPQRILPGFPVSSSWMFRQDGAATKRPQCQQGRDGSKQVTRWLDPGEHLVKHVISVASMDFRKMRGAPMISKKIWNNNEVWEHNGTRNTQMEWKQDQIWRVDRGGERRSGSDPSPKDGDLSLWIPTTKRLTNDFSIVLGVTNIIILLLHVACGHSPLKAAKSKKTKVLLYFYIFGIFSTSFWDIWMLLYF